MPLELELDQVISAETGVRPLVNGAPADFWVIPVLDERAEYAGGHVDRDGPYAIAIAAEVARKRPTTGNNGDTMTIGSHAYTILAIRDGSRGTAIIDLARKQP